jgi:hypothetical protein
MLSNLDNATTNKSQAVCLLQKYIDPSEMTLLVARILEDGFQTSMEPFVMSVFYPSGCLSQDSGWGTEPISLACVANQVSAPVLQYGILLNPSNPRFLQKRRQGYRH